MKKKILSILLSVALVFSVVPMGILSVSAAEPNYRHTMSDNKGVKTENTTVFAYNRTGDNQADAQAILDGVTQGAEDLSPTYMNMGDNTLTSNCYTYNENGYTSSSSFLRDRLTKVPKSGDTYYYLPSMLTKDTDGDITTTGDQTYPYIEDNEASSLTPYEEDESRKITKQYGYSNGKAYYYDAAGGDKKYDIAGLEEGDPYCYEEAIYNLKVSKHLTDIVVGRQYSGGTLSTSNYKVYTSTDGTNYTEVYNYDIANFDGGDPLFEIIHFDTPIKAQYIKLRILDSVNGNFVGQPYYFVGPRITTFKVFGYEYETSADSEWIKNYNGSVGTKVYSYAQVNAATDGTNYFNAKKKYILTNENIINIGNTATMTSAAYKYDESSGTYTKMFDTYLATKVNDKKDMCENAAGELPDAENSNEWLFADKAADSNKIIKQYGYANGKAYYYDSNGKTVAPEEMGSNPYRYEDLKYEFTAGTGITAVAVSSQSAKWLATSNYKVLVGDSYDALQEVYNYNMGSYSFSTYNRTQLICFDEPIYAKYVVIRILDPVSQSMVGQSGGYLAATRLPLARVYGYAANISVSNKSEITQMPTGTVSESFYSLSAKTGKDNLHLVQYNSAGLPVSGGVQFADDAKRKIMDGPADGDAQIQGNWTAADAGTQWHTDIYYDFGAVCDVKEVVVSHHADWLRPDRYAVYASDNLYDLYSDENIVGCELNGNNVKGAISIQQNFIATEPIEARYVGMRIWRPQPGVHPNGMYIRLYEFNAYGCTKADAKCSVTAADSDLPTGSSICTSAPTVRYKESTDGGEFVETESVTADNTLYDNNTSTAYTTKSYFADESGVYIDGTTAAATKQRVVDIEYDLGASKDFNSIYVASKSGVDALGRYVVYASNDKDTLYSDANVVADYNNSEGYEKCPYNKSRQMFTLKNSVNARYVALRIIDPKTGHQNIADTSAYTATIQEFNLYQSDFTISSGTASETNTSAYEADAKIGKSLIRGKNSTGNMLKDGEKVPFTVTGRGDKGDKNDESARLWSYSVTAADSVRYDVDWNGGASYNDNKTSLIDDDTVLYQQVDYELDGEAKISQIGVFGHGNKDLNFSHIKLIFADTKDGLYNLDAAGTTVYDVRNQSGLAYIIATPAANKPVTAKYFAVRIVCGINSSALNWEPSVCYGRIRHISLLGEYTDAADATAVMTAPDNTTQVVPNTDLNGNYPVGATATLTANAVEGKKFVKWTDSADKYISNNTTYSYTLSSTAPATVKPVYTAAADKVVKLTDTKSGEIIDILYGSNDETLTTALINAAPKKFGYTVKGINGNISVEDSVSPIYARDTENANYKYTITAKDVGDETGKTLEDVYFDTRVIVTSESAAENIYWKNNSGSVIGVEKTIDFYACANDTVTAYEGTETAPAVTMFAATDTSTFGVFSGKSMTVFGKFDVETAPAKFGVAFTSKTKYDAAGKDWNTIFANGNAQVVEFTNNSSAQKGYFMGTLQGITTNSQTTRYAVCFVEDASGNRTYSATQNVVFTSGS